MKKVLINTGVILVLCLLCSNAFASTTNINGVIKKHKEKVKGLSSFSVEYTYFKKPFLKAKPHISNRKFIFSQKGNLESDSFEFILTIDDTLQILFVNDTIFTIDHVSKKIFIESQNDEIVFNRYSNDTYLPLFDDYYMELLGLDDTSIYRGYRIGSKYIDSTGHIVLRYYKNIGSHFLIDSSLIEYRIDTTTCLVDNLSIFTFGVEDKEEIVYTLSKFVEPANIDGEGLYIQDTISHFFKESEYSVGQYDLNMKAAPNQIKLGSIFPNISLTGLEKDGAKIYDLCNNWTAIELWYAGCIPCLQSIPSLNSFYTNRAKDSISLISVNPYDGANIDNVKKVKKKLGIQYPVYFSDRSLIEDYGIHSYPTTIVLNKDKVVVGLLVGGSSMPISSRIMSVINSQNKDTPK